MIPVLQGGESKKLEWTVQAKKGSKSQGDSQE